jgi:hypothetical protein
MPRFYLHVCDGVGFAQDEEGLELPDRAAAREAAIQGLRDIMASEVKGGGINLASFVEKEDERRRLIETVSFTDAVSLAISVSRAPR